MISDDGCSYRLAGGGFLLLPVRVIQFVLLHEVGLPRHGLLFVSDEVGLLLSSLLCLRGRTPLVMVLFVALACFV